MAEWNPHMNPRDYTIDLTPGQFEREVKSLLETAGRELTAFQTTHREKLDGVDGTYEIDVLARFEALGADFTVLVECKHQKNHIKRDIVQILHDRVRATGAHKGMIFATTCFQKGAIEYATIHGIALIQMVEGKTLYRTRSQLQSPPPEPPASLQLPPYAGWLITAAGPNAQGHQLVSVDYTETMVRFLNFNGDPEIAT